MMVLLAETFVVLNITQQTTRDAFFVTDVTRYSANSVVNAMVNLTTLPASIVL